MDGKLLFCVSVGQGDNLLYGPEWKEAERGISLVDLFLQVCGSKVLGQQVQVCTVARHFSQFVCF